ncbi:ferrous iron transporter B, partial [Martensiomyces pterosporus]
MSGNQLTRRMVVLGHRGGVGKSTAIHRFIENDYLETYYPTIEAEYEKTIKVNGTLYTLEIVDTAGQDEFSLLDSRYAVNVDVYVVAFSVATRKSFEMARVIHDKILDLTGTEKVPMILAGNKIDLEDERQVSREEALALAKEFGCPYIETSAKKNQNINEIF